MADPLDIPKYRNAPHAAYTIVKEEGVRALYKGVTLTALRQGNWRLDADVYNPVHILIIPRIKPQTKLQTSLHTRKWRSLLSVLKTWPSCLPINI